ncbi:MAG: DUF2442 domain-containing protein [Chitinophagales bacterium]|nr:DUF2442 domain-containing protein [Chitinophagales bacterium]
MKLFPKVSEVKPLPGYKIWVKYADGKSGEVDLSDMKGKGVFKFWDDADNFYKVHIDEITGAIAWSNQLDICPDSVYLQLIGKNFEEYASH